MFTTAIIAFREFFEAFLIVGIFLGISKRLNLKREVEILFAASVGFVISLVMSTLLYIFSDFARAILTEERAELLESYLLIFSGFFIAYVIFSLHDVLSRSRGGKLLKAHQKLEKNSFDISLFITIVMLVVREGFEIALFTASTSLFTVFLQNFIGLLTGFASAGIIGSLSYISYLKLPIGKVFKVTEYMIILLGASLVQNGITELFEHTWDIDLSSIFSIHLTFLPSASTSLGHLVQSFVGIDQHFSLIRLLIMIFYIGGVYFLFLRKQPVPVKK
jgi:FTR1 family protein